MVGKTEYVPEKKARVSKFGFSRKNLCIPYGLFLALFVILPLLVIVYYAFTDSNGAFTFYNVVDFFTDTTKISTLLISVLVSLIVTVICLLIAYPVAYILSKMSGRVAFILLLLFIMPMWINFVLRAMAMKELLYLINIPLGSFANIIGLVYDFLPFMILPLYSTLIKMDKSLTEAAADLGAGKVKVFKEITLPLSVPGIISGAMMVFLPVMSCYVITDAFSGSTGFTVIGKLIAWCFLGENGTMTNQHGGAMISLIMLVILFATMFATGGFKSEDNVRGTNL
ncbi:MAG: ABC transporter permease [Clostridia bacterium]|nr:ABC transporter permease [Clostridia bacterium]